MDISVFDLFSIGIGPSSSHTVGPMRAALRFLDNVDIAQCDQICVELYGSLALTGKGHGTDKAILLGLSGYAPEKTDPSFIELTINAIHREKKLNLNQQKFIAFDPENDIKIYQKQVLPCHTNGLRFIAYHKNNVLIEEVYYSVGGGFIVREDEFGEEKTSLAPAPFTFNSAEELLRLCRDNQLTIAELMMENEKTWLDEETIKKRLHNLADIMEKCIDRGCHTSGTLPGGLNVKRRAADIYKQLTEKGKPKSWAHSDAMSWVNMFAIAVNEENAAGGRIVTAPTNGAAGIIPAVLSFYKHFSENITPQKIEDFLLTAAAIAILYKKNASISGAEVGCQGEVGVAASMAAAALTAVLDEPLDKIENAAEIAMEHHLGMTCDPINGLVQIPCIERNAMGAVKAINAARLAILGSGEHKVSLDKVIATMKQTGLEMNTIFKETSLGGLAANVPEC